MVLKRVGLWRGRSIGWIACVVLAFGTQTSAGEPVTVFAAASLTTAMDRLVEAAPDTLRIRVSVGGSSTLARQIEQGAPADIIVSANVAWMDYLQRRGLLEPRTRTDLVRNSLVVIARRGVPVPVQMNRGFDFAGAFEGRLAMGDPSHVPAGIYARQALQWMGWWEGVKDRTAPATDVRGALTLVSRGQCDVGIVYATDAENSGDVVTVGAFPDSSHDSIVYPAAVVAGRLTPDVLSVMAFLRSDEAGEVLEGAGFIRRDRTTSDP